MQAHSYFTRSRNPCFTGLCRVSLLKDYKLTAALVAILVLLDYVGFQEAEAERIRREAVAILVLLDYVGFPQNNTASPKCNVAILVLLDYVGFHSKNDKEKDKKSQSLFYWIM